MNLMQLKKMSLLCLLFFSAFAYSVDNLSAEQWLSRMVNDSKKLNYEGALTYQYGNKIVSAKMYHSFVNGEEQRRLVYLDGTPNEVVRQGDTLTYLQSKKINKSAQSPVDVPHVQDLAKKLSNVSVAYHLSMGKKARVAGREVVVVKMQPKDPFRYAQTLYIDRQTGLLLKSETMGDDTRPLERFQFVQVNIGSPISASLLKLKTWKNAFVRTQKVQHKKHNTDLSWRLAWVPKGYTLVSSNQGLREASSCMYSDGVSSFSVYMEPASAGQMNGAMRKGASIVVSQTVELKGKAKTAVVAGDIPITTAERIIQSISPVN